jgi:hypothetical protein
VLTQSAAEVVLERRPGDDVDEEVDEWEWRKRIS